MCFTNVNEAGIRYRYFMYSTNKCTDFNKNILERRVPDKLRICIFYAMKMSKNACIVRSECTHYAYILLCKQTFQIQSVLVQSCT